MVKFTRSKSMKNLKFRRNLVPLVLSGQKTSTWRLFDDKNLSVGDAVELKVFVTLEMFGKAVITDVITKPFKDLSVADKTGHEEFKDDDEMYATYSKYYSCTVDWNTELKIISFKLV